MTEPIQDQIKDRAFENLTIFGASLAATQLTPYIYGASLPLTIAAPALALFFTIHLPLSLIQENLSLTKESFSAKYAVDPLAFAGTMLILQLAGITFANGALLPIFAFVLLGRALMGIVGDMVHKCGLAS